jgi:peptide/nickel transport system substrate-binding protein
MAGRGEAAASGPGSIAVAVAIILAGCFERGGAREEAAAETAVAGRVRAGDRDVPGELDPAATIRVRLEGEPAHLNPLLSADALTARVAADVYEGLLCGVVPAPCLAESVLTDPSGRIWVFDLRQARFHHGRPVEVADVRWSFGLLGAAPSPWAGELDDLVGLASDGRRVVLAFAGFRPARAEAIARVPILPRERFAGVAPAALAGAAENRAPSGTGPLRWVSWRDGVIALERWDGHWGEPARARRIEYHVVDGRDRARLLLAAGELDVVGQLPLDEVAAVDDAALAPFTYDQPGYLAAVFDTRRPPLADPRVRRGLSLLVDRGELGRAVLGGAPPAAGPFVPDDDDADPTVAPLPFDPAGAARLFAEAGVRRPRLEVLVPAGSRTMARLADVWAADAAPHADLVVVSLPWAEVIERGRAGRFDVILSAFTSGRELDLHGRLASASIGGENWGGLVDRELDRLLDAARREPDRAARRALRRAIHRRLDALSPYAFIAVDRRAGLVRRGVEGAAAMASGGGARALGRRR